MAGNCNISRKNGIVTSVTAPNGKPSIMFDSILLRTGDPEAAAEIYSQIYEDDFKEAFGMDFQTDPKAHNPTLLSTDSNGEPRILDGQGYYYAVNTKTGERVKIEGMQMNIEQPIRYVSRGMQNEVVHILMTFLNDARKIKGKKFDSQLIDFMGNGKEKGILAEIALTQSFFWPKGMSMSERRRIAVKAEETRRKESNKAMMDSLPAGVVLDRGKANIFFRVYRDWFSKVDEKGTGNLLSIGWSELVKDVFPDYGYKYSEDRGWVDENDDDPVRIHSQARLQENPKDKLSSTVKSFLTDIRSTSLSPRLGYPIAIPLDSVYLQIADASHGQSSFKGMIRNLEILSKYKPELEPVIKRLRTLSTQEEAAFFANFSNSYKRFLTFRLDREETEGGDTVVSFKMFPSHANTLPSRAKAKWKANSIDEEGETTDALYYVDNDSLLKMREDKQKTIIDLYKEVIAPLKRVRTEKGQGVSPQSLDALSTILWEAGLHLGETAQEAKNNLETFFMSGDLKGDSGQSLLKKHVFHPHKSLSKLVEVIKNGENIHTSEAGKEVIDLWAGIVPYFVTNPAESFLGGSGKVYYPINLSTPLDNMVRDLKSNKFFDFASTVGLTPLFDPTGDEKYRSPLMSLLIGGEKGNPQVRNSLLHELEDSFKGLDSVGVGEDYSAQNYKTSLLVRLNAFANHSGLAGHPTKNFKFAISTQETRERLDFLTLPRFETYSRIGANDMKTVEDFIRATIIQDMAVMYQAHLAIVKEKTPLIEGYHYKKGSPRNAMDGSVFTMPQIHELRNDIGRGKIPLYVFFPIIKNPENSTSKEVEQVNKEIDRLVKKVSARLDEYTSSVENTLKRYKVTNDELDPYLRNNPSAIRSFVVNDFVSRIEVNKILRAGMSYAKDPEDFYKRMGLINTPGTLLFIKGTGTDSESDYGMTPTYKVATFESLDYQYKEDANANADIMEDNMKKNGVPAERAERIADSQRSVDKTDAQGLISVHMWRRIQMGKGEWDMVWDEQAYRNELEGKGYVDDNGDPRPLMPTKPFHEEVFVQDDAAAVAMDKTHFTVLVRDFAAGYPVLSKLYNTMTVDRKFDVALENGATKGARLEPIDLYEQDPSDAPVMIRDSSKLRFPQNVPATEEKKIIFSRQLRRNLMSDWMLSKELLEEFDSLVAENVEADISKLERSLGLQSLIDATGTEDKAGAKLRYLQNLRNLLRSQIRSKGLAHNYLGALDIVPNGPGDFRFAIPLSFPNFQSKFEQIFLSIYNDRVFKQKLMGKSLVQIAELGGHVVDRELDMYNGTSPAQVRMRAKDLGFPPGTKYEDVMEDERLFIIGYRMPNQGKNSMLPMHVVGFIPDSYEKSIVVPGGITKQMGADFDVDKLNIIMRGQGDPAQKESEGKKLDRKDRDAAIWDIMWTAITAGKHLDQVLDPLDNDTLYDLAAAEESEKKAVDYNDPLNEIEMEMKNKLGARMVGIWANALSGHAMAQTEKPDGSPYISIAEEYAPIFDGNMYDRLGSKYVIEETEGDTEFASRGVVSHMNIAVDAGKKPIHRAINDNKFTAPAYSLMLTTGVSQETATRFLMQPAIKEVVEYLDNNSLDPRDVNKAIRHVYRKYGGKGNLDVSTSDIETSKLETHREDKDFQRLVLLNFKAMNTGGRAVMTAYKVITPDSLENMNEISGINAWLDVENDYLSGEKSSIVKGALDLIRRPKEKDDPIPSRIQIAYRDMMDRALLNAEAAGFINNRPAFHQFKELLKSLSGKQTLTADQHKFVDRVLFLKLMATEQSPWIELMSYIRRERMYKYRKGNIADRFETLKDSGKLEGNPMFNAFEKDNIVHNDGSITFNITFRGAKEAGPNYQNRLIDGFYEMMDSSDEQIREFAVDLVAHQLNTSGYLPGPRSYIETFPKEFLTSSMIVPEKESPAAYFSKIQEETLDRNFFDDFLHEFVKNFGSASPGGYPLLQKISAGRVKGLSNGPLSLSIESSAMESALRTPNGWTPYFVTYLSTGPEIYVYREVKASYDKLSKKGIPKRFVEIVGTKSIFDQEGIDFSPSLSFIDKGKKREAPLPESVSEPIRKLCRIG